MPKILVHHSVKDQAVWLSSELRAEKLAGVGVTDLQTFFDPTNPSRVGFTAEVADLDALVAYLQTDDAAQAMATDGVLADTVVMLIKN